MEWSEGGKWDNCNGIINKYILKRNFRCLDPWRVNIEVCVLQSFPEILHNIKVQSPTKIAGIVLLLLVALSFLCTSLHFLTVFIALHK